VKTQKLGDEVAAEKLLGWKEKTKGDIQGEGLGSMLALLQIGNLESTSWQLLYLHSCGSIVEKSGSGFCQIFF